METDSTRASVCKNFKKIALPGSWIRGFDAANAASEYSDGVPNRDKMGAAIFSGGRLLSVGFNLYWKGTPRGITIKRGKEITLSLHAEEAALTKIKYRDYNKNKLVMYIFRKDCNNNPVASKPCSACQELLSKSGIKVARYINGEGLPEEMRF